MIVCESDPDEWRWFVADVGTPPPPMDVRSGAFAHPWGPPWVPVPFPCGEPVRGTWSLLRAEDEPIGNPLELTRPTYGPCMLSPQIPAASILAVYRVGATAPTLAVGCESSGVDQRYVFREVSPWIANGWYLQVRGGAFDCYAVPRPVTCLFNPAPHPLNGDCQNVTYT